ncbi:hypothetical protein AB0395_20710 [Streptosporangium sp. NPDC051023]|uniref:hypothetical protein n=1 Tax=Streptosporangium sp. NPDC051023 TaxID=3155410 RepID=UPI0034509743
MSEAQNVSKGSLAAAPKIWRQTVQANPAAAVAFVNSAPAQVAGEAVFSNRADGKVDVYYFL